MEINYRQQDKFITHQSTLWIDLIDGSSRVIDFIEIEKAIKDFCFIRHELSNYCNIYASQFSFENHLSLPYWEYLFIKGQINEGDKNELEEGALLTIYLFYKEIFEGEVWSQLNKHNLYETIENAIQKYKPDNEKKAKAKECIIFSMKNYNNHIISDQYGGSIDENSENLLKKMVQNDNWIYNEFVEKYYIDKANSFESLRQKTKDFFNNLVNSSSK